MTDGFFWSTDAGEMKAEESFFEVLATVGFLSFHPDGRVFFPGLAIGPFLRCGYLFPLRNSTSFDALDSKAFGPLLHGIDAVPSLFSLSLARSSCCSRLLSILGAGITRPHAPLFYCAFFSLVFFPFFPSPAR